MPSPAAEPAEKYAALAASFVKEHRLPGAAVGVVHEGELVWSGGIGFADVAKKRPATRRALYRIASITKTFTATAVMQLRDEGEALARRSGRRVPARAEEGIERRSARSRR